MIFENGLKKMILKLFVNDFENWLWYALHLHIKNDVTLMQILSVLIGKQWIVQHPIRSEVTKEVAQIVLLAWMVGKHLMHHR